MGRKLTGNTAIGVHCTGGKPWTIRVPGFVKVTCKLAVTSHPILCHTIISSGDVRLEKRDISAQSNSHIVSQGNVMGKLAKRAVTNATALSPDILNVPLLKLGGKRLLFLPKEAVYKSEWPGRPRWTVRGSKLFALKTSAQSIRFWSRSSKSEVSESNCNGNGTQGTTALAVILSREVIIWQSKVQGIALHSYRTPRRKQKDKSAEPTPRYRSNKPDNLPHRTR